METHPANIIKIARFYRAMNISALIWFIGFGLSTNGDRETAMVMLLLKLILLIIAIPSFIYSASRLSFALGGYFRFLIVIFLCLGIAIFFGQDIFAISMLGLLIVICILTFAVRKKMTTQGVKMGFLGPKIK